MTEHRATEADRGNAIAGMIWRHLQEAKRIDFVPWVDQYSERKAGESAGRRQLIDELEAIIEKASEDIDKPKTVSTSDGLRRAWLRSLHGPMGDDS